MTEEEDQQEDSTPVAPGRVAPAGHKLPIPWIKLRSAGSGPTVFKRMIGEADLKARPGDIVAVYDKQGAPYGVAFYNPRSLIALRLLTRGIAADFDAEKFFGDRIAAAVEFRRKTLDLDKVTDAYRLIHDQGDGMPGVVIDRFGQTIVLEFYTLAMFKQAARLERLLAVHFPDAKFVRRANEYSEKMEGFKVDLPRERDAQKTRVKENGVLFEVTPFAGRKTGFFCDQRDNRLMAAGFAKGKTVIDICSYTGGFGVYAMKVGGAESVTCVELDPESTELIKRNANINQVRVDAVCADAFPYLRQMQENNKKYGLVILDPYKLINSRENYDYGRKKYIDFNRLAFSLVEPGGVMITCSCSGMLQWPEFQQIVRTAAGSAGRRVQIFRKTGAGGDHPVAVDYPESEYLKVIWCRVQ